MSAKLEWCQRIVTAGNEVTIVPNGKGAYFNVEDGVLVCRDRDGDMTAVFAPGQWLRAEVCQLPTEGANV